MALSAVHVLREGPIVCRKASVGGDIQQEIGQQEGAVRDGVRVKQVGQDEGVLSSEEARPGVGGERGAEAFERLLASGGGGGVLRAEAGREAEK
jgi:hypothetical protein